ncbi:MAG: CaiB/BaiF CoA transferase family protein [Candidatus Competibacterales bacterium]
MAGPLQGYRILDLTSVVSGPVATMLLADQGAEVTKVEAFSGDFTRQAANRRGGFSASFVNNNRGKRSVVLNLKDPRGVAIVGALAKVSDVVVQNFRPGVVERLGIGFADLQKLNPRLVYASISGFGTSGPYAQRPVYDPLIQALSGLTTVQGGSDQARPRLVRTILPDKLTGFLAAQAITAALLARERTGEGQHVELSMLDGLVNFLWHSDMGSQTFVGCELPQAEAQSFIDLIYRTRDGYVSVAVQTDRQWRALAEALGRPEWLGDERFKTAAQRQENIDARLALTQEALEHFTSQECLDRLQAHDVPCAPVLRRCEVIHHPQVLANEVLRELDHPHAGRLRQTRPAARFSHTPVEPGGPAPALGEHSEMILRELGYDEQTIAQWVTEGVVGVFEATPRGG